MRSPSHRGNGRSSLHPSLGATHWCLSISLALVTRLLQHSWLGFLRRILTFRCIFLASYQPKLLRFPVSREKQMSFAYIVPPLKFSCFVHPFTMAFLSHEGKSSASCLGIYSPMLSKGQGRAGNISQLIHQERVWFSGIGLAHRANASSAAYFREHISPRLSYQSIHRCFAGPLLWVLLWCL